MAYPLEVRYHTVMPLLILNANPIEPTDYAERKTVKAVITNERSEVFLFSSTLIGGGVEDGESDEQALAREANEEAGIEITILKPLGEIVQYRDFLKKKYVVQGYLCTYAGTLGDATTTDASERDRKKAWVDATDAITTLQSEIEALKKEDPTGYTGDAYQAKLYNRETALTFLLESR